MFNQAKKLSSDLQSANNTIIALRKELEKQKENVLESRSARDSLARSVISQIEKSEQYVESLTSLGFNPKKLSEQKIHSNRAFLFSNKALTSLLKLNENDLNKICYEYDEFKWLGKILPYIKDDLQSCRDLRCWSQEDLFTEKL